MIAHATDLPEQARCDARPKCRPSVDGDGEYRYVVVVETGRVQTLDELFDEPLWAARRRAGCVQARDRMVSAW